VAFHHELPLVKGQLVDVQVRTLSVIAPAPVIRLTSPSLKLSTSSTPVIVTFSRFSMSMVWVRSRPTGAPSVSSRIAFASPLSLRNKYM
jgi:hypothetical protein